MNVCPKTQVRLYSFMASGSVYFSPLSNLIHLVYLLNHKVSQMKVLNQVRLSKSEILILEL